jgi:hypothetical protein
MRILGTVASSSREVPGAPTIGTATNVGSGRAYNNGRADITFTAPTFDGGLPILDYTVTSSPGGFTATGASSPLTVTGLQSGVAYTFTVTARTAIGTGPASAASNSITATTIPQVPTITSATRSSNTVVSIAFTGATGGAALSAVTATSSPSVSITSSGTSSPMTATAAYASGTSYTFTITATNANGTTASSSASGSVIPSPVPSAGAWSSSTAVPVGRNVVSGVGNNTGIRWAGGTNSGGSNTNDSYSWNGSSWSSTPLAGVRSYVGIAANNSGGIFALGGYSDSGLTSTNYYASSFSASWGTGTSMPFSDAESAGAGLSSGIIYCRYYTSPGELIWLSTPNGTWATGTTAPRRLTTWTNNSDWSKAFGAWEGEFEFYSLTAFNGTYTTETTLPTNNTTGCTLMGNQGALWYTQGNNGTNTYRYANGTWTTQTATPVKWALGKATGVVSNVWSLYSNRQNSTDASTGHYRSTIS